MLRIYISILFFMSPHEYQGNCNEEKKTGVQSLLGLIREWHSVKDLKFQNYPL